MVDSDMIQFCLANVSRNDRMASRVHDLGLKARYAESANHWRRLAEQMRNEAYPTSQRSLALLHQCHDVGHEQGARRELLEVERPSASSGDNESQEVACRERHDPAENSVRQIEARLDPLTGQWECPGL